MVSIGSDGALKPLCDVALHVEINDMQIVEDVHMIFDHLMMSILCGYFKKIYKK